MDGSFNKSNVSLNLNDATLLEWNIFLASVTQNFPSLVIITTKCKCTKLKNGTSRDDLNFPGTSSTLLLNLVHVFLVAFPVHSEELITLGAKHELSQKTKLVGVVSSVYSVHLLPVFALCVENHRDLVRFWRLQNKPPILSS